MCLQGLMILFQSKKDSSASLPAVKYSREGQQGFELLKLYNLFMNPTKKGRKSRLFCFAFQTLYLSMKSCCSILEVEIQLHLQTVTAHSPGELSSESNSICPLSSCSGETRGYMPFYRAPGHWFL